MPSDENPSRQATRVAKAKSILGDIAQHNVSLARYTTYKVGGTSDLFARCTTREHLKLVSEAHLHTRLPVLTIGLGSNMLVADRGFPGIAVQLGGDFATSEFDGPEVNAGGAIRLQKLAATCGEMGLHGLEWTIGIPASVGGAVCMNAGMGPGGESIQDHLTTATVFDITTGESRVRTNDALEFRFRGSAISDHHIVESARFELEQTSADECQDLQQAAVDFRRRAHPGGRNAGSVFVTAQAWKLIQDAGAHKVRRGCASVSPKHSNFIVVDSSSPPCADDVLAVMIEVRNLVKRECGIELKAETRLVGFTDSEMAQAGCSIS